MNLIPRNFFFDDDLDTFFAPSIRKNDAKCDIYEEDNEYHIEMDVPGYDKKDINIEIKDGYLTIKGNKSFEEEKETKRYIRKERAYGSFERSFALGDVDVESIDANFNNGTLSIVIPKIEAKDTTKKIEIK